MRRSWSPRCSSRFANPLKVGPVHREQPVSVWISLFFLSYFTFVTRRLFCTGCRWPCSGRPDTRRSDCRQMSPEVKIIGGKMFDIYDCCLMLPEVHEIIGGNDVDTLCRSLQ